MPGLGKSESFYAMAVAMYSIGEFVGALGAGPLTRLVSYRQNFLWSLVVCVVGNLLYGIGMRGWMVLMGRFFIGVNCGLLLVLITSYIGVTASEVSEKQQQLKQVSKSKTNVGYTLKDKLFVGYSFTTTLSYLIAPGECELMHHFVSSCYIY